MARNGDTDVVIEGARLKGRASGGDAHHSISATIRRRELLVAVSTLVAFFGLPSSGYGQSASAKPIDLGSFRELTSALTGISPSDAALPQLFLDAFAADADDLGRLHAILTDQTEAEWDKAIDAAGLKPLEQALLQAWYTGSVGLSSEERVLTYLDAFVWHACGYTKPPTRCDTNFGAWAEAPPPGRFQE